MKSPAHAPHAHPPSSRLEAMPVLAAYGLHHRELPRNERNAPTDRVRAALTVQQQAGVLGQAIAVLRPSTGAGRDDGRPANQYPAVEASTHA